MTYKLLELELGHDAQN